MSYQSPQFHQLHHLIVFAMANLDILMESAVASVLPDPKSDSILPKIVRKSTASTYVCPPEADQHPACQQMGLKFGISIQICTTLSMNTTLCIACPNGANTSF